MPQSYLSSCLSLSVCLSPSVCLSICLLCLPSVCRSTAAPWLWLRRLNLCTLLCAVLCYGTMNLLRLVVALHVGNLCIALPSLFSSSLRYSFCPFSCCCFLFLLYLFLLGFAPSLSLLSISPCFSCVLAN